MDFTFGKEKHLCGETTIARLYKEGRAFIAFPLRVVYLIEKRDDSKPRPTVRLLVAAPKKRFRHAVDRNRYRRLLREAYRHRQSQLLEKLDSLQLTADISLVAVHNQLSSQEEINIAIDKIISKITTHLPSGTPNTDENETTSGHN